MKQTIFIGIAVAALALGALPVRAEQPKELSVSTYIDITLARLQLIADTWAQYGQSPNAREQQLVLWEWYGTTARAYYVFAGSHSHEIDQYLAAHPQMREDIERLSSHIQGLISRVETQ